MKKRNRMLALLLATTTVVCSIMGCGSTETSDSGNSSHSSHHTRTESHSGSTSSKETMSGKSENTAPSVGYIVGDAEAPATASSGLVTENAMDSGACYDTTCGGYDYDYGYYPYYEENTESYQKPEENGFSLAMANPLSTFAADVDTASYANVRRMIESGYAGGDIPAAAVRPEEFINYFSYDLNGPDRGEKFGVTTEVSVCPWNPDHQLLFVGVKAEDQLEGQIPESNLVFLIDVSGSMASSNKLDLLKNAFVDLVDNLEGDGTVSIVTYASEEKVVLDGARMSDKRAIKKAINSLSAGGATAGERGMEMAYEVARDNFIEGGNNRIIMATDGDLNVGISDPDELEKFIEQKKDDGIFLSVLGFGDGNYKDDRLERLADCGNGNYNYIDSKLEAKKVLVDQMSSTLVTVAKDVKFQIEFNPAMVNSFRLIGYENRQMEDVAFNDDTKDGGEIGSGHTVVALYEIVPAGSKDAIDLKYQNHTDEQKDVSDDYATVKIRYKEPDEDQSKLLTYVVDISKFNETASDNLAFASLVAEFAMLLSDSDHIGNVTYDDIYCAYNELERCDIYRNEFAQLVWMVEKRG